MTPNSNLQINKSNNDKNLIDLDTWIDIKEMSIADLFDPLVQDKSVIVDNISEELNKPLNKTDEIIKETITNNNNSEIFTRSLEINNETEKQEIIKRSPLKRNKTYPSNENNSLYEKQLTRIENFKIIEVNSTNEIESFNKSINQLSKEIKINKIELDNLIVFSPLLDSPIIRSKTIRITIKYTNNTSADLQSRFLQEIITLPLNTTVETVVYHVLTLFGIEDLNTDKYLLKIHGCEEYLPITANLADLKFLHECITENKDPILILTEIVNINTELSNKNETSSDLTNKLFSFSNKFEKNILLVSKSKIEHLLRTIIQNRKLIEESTETSFVKHNHISQLDSVINWCINLKEKFKLLVTTLGNIHFAFVENIIEKFELAEKNLKNYQININFKEKQSLTVLTDQNDYWVVESSTVSIEEDLQLIYSNLIELCNDAMHSVLLFINCASYSFNLPFKLKPIYFKKYYLTENDESKNDENETAKDNFMLNSINNYEHSETIEIIQSDESFFLYFNGLSRLNEFLNEKNFRFLFNLLFYLRKYFKLVYFYQVSILIYI
jgi:hypothetical protein